MIEIRSKLREQKYNEKDICDEIRDYFKNIDVKQDIIILVEN